MSSTNRRPEYYEAVLQLRDVKDEVIKFVEHDIPKTKMQVSKVVTLKNGKDYYLSSNDIAKKLGKKLQLTFGGVMSVTSTLHTKKKGKELHRLTILFRQASFKKGEIVTYQGEEHNVLSMIKRWKS